MAARATRSASRKARLTEAVATGPLGALSHDELGVIFDGLADPLRPAVAVALSSTCLGLRTPLQAALKLLAQWHEKAKRLCSTVDSWYVYVQYVHAPASCVSLPDAKELFWFSNPPDLLTLNMILRTNGLPKLQGLFICGVGIDEAGMQALFESLRLGGATSLRELGLQGNRCGPRGAEALAAALRGGALRKLERLILNENNNIGSQGFAALAVPLRKMPALRELFLSDTALGDDGVASL